MPCIFSRWCRPGRRYAARKRASRTLLVINPTLKRVHAFGRSPSRGIRRPAPSYQVPQSGEQTLSLFSRKLWTGRAEVHLQVDVSPDATSDYDEEELSIETQYFTAATSTTTTAATSITTTAASSPTATTASSTTATTSTSTTSSTKPSSTRSATSATPNTATTATTTTTSSTNPSSTRGGQKEKLMHRIKLVFHRVISHLKRVLRKETCGGFFGGDKRKRRAKRHRTKKCFSRRRTRGHRDRRGRIRRRHHSIGTFTSVVNGGVAESSTSACPVAAETVAKRNMVTDNVGQDGNDGTTYDATDRVDNNIKRKIKVLEVMQEKLGMAMVEWIQRKDKALKW